MKLTGTGVLAVVGLGLAGFVVWRAYSGFSGVFGGVRQAISDTMDDAGLYMDQRTAVEDMYRGTGAEGIAEPPRQVTAPWESRDPGQFWNLSDIYGA